MPTPDQTDAATQNERRSALWSGVAALAGSAAVVTLLIAVLDDGEGPVVEVAPAIAVETTPPTAPSTATPERTSAPPDDEAVAGDAIVLDVEPTIVGQREPNPDPIEVSPLPSSSVVEPPIGAQEDSATVQGDPSEGVVEEIVLPRSVPVGVATDRIRLDQFPVRSVGLEPNGELEVPDETEIGWYRYGAAPGEPGVTVLAAHVSWNRTLGPFFELGTMEPGDLVEVANDDGTVREYRVVERAMYPKNELPNERLWRNVGDESLVLITCGGRFDDTINRYRDNIVVYADPVI